MLKRLRVISVLDSNSHIKKQRVIYAVYVALFSYLILYSIFTTLYLEVSPESKLPDAYEIENIAARRVYCSFNISSQYQKTPRYICYLLLVLTIIIRNHKRLAAGAAASVMTYSGVAAIHVIILFATNDRFRWQKAKSECERVPIPGMNDPFFACHGVHDPDVGVAVAVLSSVMLGALPMAALSKTFKKTTGRAILMSWLLLLAVGHAFDNLIWTDPNRQFQVCPKDHVEPLPVSNYQTPLLDQSWIDSFQLLISAAQQPSQNDGNGSSPACIYSCFATTAYVGRRQQDIGIPRLSRSSLGPFMKSLTENRLGGIVFWWLYTILAFLSLFTTKKTEKRAYLPKWLHKRVFLLERCQHALVSRWKWTTVTISAATGMKALATASSEATGLKTCITVFALIRFLTQFLGVVVFCGSIVYLETSNAPGWNTMEIEQFAAVGQWSDLAVVLLVLLAAMIRRGLGGRGTKNAVEKLRRVEEGGEKTDRVEDEDEDVEMEIKDWDWQFGYAS